MQYVQTQFILWLWFFVFFPLFNHYKLIKMSIGSDQRWHMVNWHFVYKFLFLRMFYIYNRFNNPSLKVEMIDGCSSVDLDSAWNNVKFKQG